MPDPNEESFDLIQAICETYRESSLNWTAQHVKGHQDNHSARTLTRLEQLNVEMDREAKAYWNLLVRNAAPGTFPAADNHLIHNEGWSVWSGNFKFACPSRDNLYAEIYDPQTLAEWVKNTRLTDDSANLIDWKQVKCAMKSLPLHSRRYVTKHASDECGIGTTLVKWKYQEDCKCPRCGQDEDGDHVLLCQACGANDIWNDNVVKLIAVMDETNTHPAIQETLLHSLQQWRHQTAEPIHLPIEIEQARQEQQAIGWRNLLEGLPSKKWSQIQQRFYNESQSRRTGKRWMTSILKALHTLGRDQWLHRNAVKHQTLRPRQKKMEDRLNSNICREYTKGPHHLPHGDTIRFNEPLAAILLRSLKYKQAWLDNLLAARTRAARKHRHDDEIDIASREQSILLQWIQTGRAV